MKNSCLIKWPNRRWIENRCNTFENGKILSLRLTPGEYKWSDWVHTKTRNSGQATNTHVTNEQCSFKKYITLAWVRQWNTAIENYTTVCIFVCHLSKCVFTARSKLSMFYYVHVHAHLCVCPVVLSNREKQQSQAYNLMIVTFTQNKSEFELSDCDATSFRNVLQSTHTALCLHIKFIMCIWHPSWQIHQNTWYLICT